MATEKFEEIVEDFGFIDEWEDRYRYVIDLGKKMAEMDEAHKIPETKVHGCASQVWIMPDLSADVIRFTGDSDAMIVRGLIATLHALYDGLPYKDALEVNALKEMGRLGLDQHLSAQRSNGLRAMIERLRKIAEKQVG
ncbi:MAG: SufE family protein [Rhodobacteraceae bacterium]|nr:SufE family protein [Paracoccaceae bacterium]